MEDDDMDMIPEPEQNLAIENFNSGDVRLFNRWLGSEAADEMVRQVIMDDATNNSQQHTEIPQNVSDPVVPAPMQPPQQQANCPVDEAYHNMMQANDTPPVAQPYNQPHNQAYNQIMPQMPQPQQILQFDECHKMQVRVKYQKIAIGEGGSQNIDSEGGFVLFYNQTYPHLPPTVEHFKLPPLAPGIKGEEVTKLTMEVLKDLEKGLHIQYENCCIYATRYCRSRVFFWSVQNHDNQTVKLERKQKTKVFCIQSYITTFLDNFNRGFGSKHPCIVFTFGQQWNSSSSNLRDMLVYAEVKLHKIVEKILSQYPEQAMESIHRSGMDIQRSMESAY